MISASSHAEPVVPGCQPAAGQPAWRRRMPLVQLAILGAASGACYVAFAFLCRAFQFGKNHQERPILAGLAILAVSFALYLAAIWVARKCCAGWKLTGTIMAWALFFRLVLIPSAAFQEIDLYRYLWDGAAGAQGVSAFRYSPAEVRAAEPGPHLSDDMARLVAIREASPALEEILHRVHFPELPTVYPPVSQAVFAVAVWLTPLQADLDSWIVRMKVLLVAFDLGTCVLVFCLLRRAEMHPGWAVAYAWCPLVLKEFANSGHVDSIAVFFTTAAVYCLARAITGVAEFARIRGNVACPNSGEFGYAPLVLAAAICLGLAVGAKLYAVVLLPLFCAMLFARRGGGVAVTFGLLFLVLASAALGPMIRSLPGSPAVAPPPPADAMSPPQPGVASPAPPPHSLAGLQAFFNRWEMNDFLFLLVVENLRPNSPAYPQAWFVVVPDAWRRSVTLPLATALGTDPHQAAFHAARAITAAAFIALALVLAYRAYREPTLPVFLRSAFLTLAWFWLLSPTQNPWYWTWALPLVCFARGRAWLAVSGLVLAYYLRFWLSYHWPDSAVLGTSYRGESFFDFIVPWLEFGPWFAWLTATAFVKTQKRPIPQPCPEPCPALLRCDA